VLEELKFLHFYALSMGTTQCHNASTVTMHATIHGTDLLPFYNESTKKS